MVVALRVATYYRAGALPSTQPPAAAIPDGLVGVAALVYSYISRAVCCFTLRLFSGLPRRLFFRFRAGGRHLFITLICPYLRPHVPLPFFIAIYTLLQCICAVVTFHVFRHILLCLLGSAITNAGTIVCRACFALHIILYLRT